MKILLAVDGSAYSKRMLAWLAAHDERFDPRSIAWTLLTVVPEIPRRAGYFDLGDPAAYYRAVADDVLRPLREYAAQHGWNATFEHRVGHPAEQIAAAADAGRYDLVVLGSHGHSALAGLVLGSVASGVLARCKAPVLVIR